MEIKRSIQVVGAVIHEDENILIFRRGPNDKGAGFWEFPGGKIEANESPEQALQREIKEELDLEVKILEDFGIKRHLYPELEVNLRLFLCQIVSGTMVLREHDAFRWLPATELKLEELLEADRPFVELIQKRLKSQKIK